MKDPIITVLVATMNERPEWLKKSLDSHLANHIDKQIIVSTFLQDKNISLLRQYENRNQIEINYCDHVKHSKFGYSPCGVYFQINSALHLIRGKWFYYFSSNDYVSETKMKDELNMLNETSAKVCYSAFNVFGEQDYKQKQRTFRSEYSYPAHIRGNYVSDASLVNVEMLRKYLPYRSDLYGNLAHWDLWLRIFEGEGNVFCYNSKPAFYYRQNFDSMHNKRKSAIEKQEQIKKYLKNLLQYNNRNKIT